MDAQQPRSPGFEERGHARLSGVSQLRGAGGSLPLSGVRVLDLTRLLPGGYATLILSGLGAEVIKIEDPGSGDGTRLAPPFSPEGISGAHAVLNRGKRSVAIDLKQAAGQELMLSLVERAQVLMDAFRPGVLDRLGLSQAALRGANPHLVQVTIDAFGSGGPYESLPAHDLNTAGYGGVIGLARDRDGRPAMPSVPVIDHLAGLQAVIAVLAGLREVQQRGSDFRAEVAMSDSAASLLTLLGGVQAATGCAPSAPEALSGQLACYDLYECADGQWLTVAGLEPKFFIRMLDLMGLSELSSMQYDPQSQDRLRLRLSRRFVEHDRDHWLRLLAGSDTCVGPVNDVAQALADPNLVERGIVTQIRLGEARLAPAVRSVPWLATGAGGHSEADASTRLPAPALGADTAAVLTEMGLTAERIDDLSRSGVVV